jgi:holliday junction DNA helicase RuvB
MFDFRTIFVQKPKKEKLEIDKEAENEGFQSSRFGENWRDSEDLLYVIGDEKENQEVENNPKLFRPLTFDEYIGQEKAKNILKNYISATQKRNITFPHTLIYGKAGTGKTTLARIIANNLSIYFSENIAQKNCDIGKLIGELKKNNGGIIFYDEIHGFSRNSVESIYSIMEDFKYGNNILPTFTLIGATTELGEILKNRKPFYDRFKIIIELEDYSWDELKQIGTQYKNKVFPNDLLSDKDMLLLAKNCRNTPRHLIRLLESTVYFDGNIQEVFNMFGIIKDGYNIKDYKVLELLSLREKGTGLQEISIYLDIPQETYLYEIEGFLLKNGMISRTSRGRKITDKGKILFKELGEIKKDRI